MNLFDKTRTAPKPAEKIPDCKVPNLFTDAIQNIYDEIDQNSLPDHCAHICVDYSARTPSLAAANTTVAAHVNVEDSVNILHSVVIGLNPPREVLPLILLELTDRLLDD